MGGAVRRPKEGIVTEAGLRTIDEAITSWPDVRAKQVFGHRGYVRGRRMFAFLTDDGVGVKVPSFDDAAALFATDGVQPFMYAGMEMRGWAVLPVRSQVEVSEALSWVQRSYEAV